MPPKLWERVKDVVYHALDMDPEDWPRHLRESCTDDETFKEARSLLEVSLAVDDFIEVPVLDLLRRDLAPHSR